MGAVGKSSLRPRLREVTLRLEQLQSTIVVAVAALRQQNCELDADVANLLQRSVADPLHEQLELLRILARSGTGRSGFARVRGT